MHRTNFLFRRSCLIVAFWMAVFAFPSGLSEAQKQTRPFLLNIRDFGAVGDGRALDTAPIQKAIRASSEAGGGIVYVPPGRYKVGTIFLASNLTLHLDPGATLICSKAMKDFVEVGEVSYVRHLDSRFAMLYGDGLKNVSILGGGTIDGNMALDSGISGHRGPIPINFEHSQRVSVQDITVMRNPGGAAFNFFDCCYLNISRARTFHSFAGGFNLSRCQDVLMDAVIDDGSQDDPICLKNDSVGYSYKTAPPGGFVSSNILIRNDTVRNSSHGAIKIGTGSFGVFRNIIVTDCTFENLDEMFRIMLYRKSLKEDTRRAIEDVIFSNITLKNVGKFFNFGTSGPETPVIRNIMVTNVIADGLSAPSVVYGSPEAPITGLTLSNVKAVFRRMERPVSTWLQARYLHGLKLSNVWIELTESARSALVYEDGRDLELEGVRIQDAFG
ncbi:MAG: hypothetical protein EXQ58_00670 [Acidobacteria bacterium]|nr:hypothetical protein [Acidobacteriota bacterium]